MLDALSDSLKDVVRKLVRVGRIDEKTIDEIVKDIQRAFLQSDVDVKLVMELSSRIKNRSLKEKISKGMDPREHVISIVYEELCGMIGEGTNIPLKPQTILMVGLQGSGKTTSSAKLARYFQKKGLRPGIICADIYRPAAYEQLKQLCEEINVPFYGEGGDAISIVKSGMDRIKADVKIIDTAGRHALEEDLIEEMKRIRELTNPDQRLLVIDASLGQTASEHAKAFDDAIGITGVIVTKLDGTAKGGGALSAVSQAGCPITFTGTGETMDDLESFEPDGFISRLLGMGDVKALIERAESLELKEEEMESMISGKFTLKDLYKQLEMIKKLGPLKQVMNLLPFGSMGIDLSDDAYQLTGEKLNSYRVIMDSMTDEELERPGLMSGSRIRRVSIGSGKSPEEVRELLKYHKMVKRAMKGMRGNKIPMKKIMGKFKI